MEDLMLKYKKITWYVTLALGGLACLSAASLMVIWGLQNNFALIPFVVLALGVFGGAWLSCISVNAIKLLTQTPVQTPSASNKQKQLAQESLSNVLPQVVKNFSRSLALSILIIAAVIFVSFYCVAHGTELKNESVDTVTGVLCERGKVTGIVSEDYRGQQEIEDVPVGNQMVYVEVGSACYILST